ncbi:unnamed protein product, partial [Medioppia subpectinata]
DSHSGDFVANLAELVAIKSVSGEPEARDETIRAVHWMQKRLNAEGCTTRLVDPGLQTLPDGTRIPLPPVLLGQLGRTDPHKKTVCVYGHLDVQPAHMSDGWHTDPFTLTEKEGKLYGRGATDDKGPVLGWLHAIQAYNNTGVELPVNFKFIFEGMEESDSVGLDDVVIAEAEGANGLLADVDYICISDSNWLGATKPTLTYGLRGISYFYIDIEGAAKDLHSGAYGGGVHEAMTDLVALMNRLVDTRGRILVPGVMDAVLPLTPDEEALYRTIDFNSDEFRDIEVGARRLIHNDKVDTLTHIWRYPSLSLHGIEGAHSTPGAKTVIPGRVVGKFSIRLVPNQDPNNIERLVTDYLNQEFNKLDSPNKLKITMVTGAKPWLADPNDPNFSAGRKATKTVFGVDPDLCRDGGSIPITLTFQSATGKSVLLINMGASDDGPHSQNEKINKWNYIEVTKVFAAYLYELARMGEN